MLVKPLADSAHKPGTVFSIAGNMYEIVVCLLKETDPYFASEFAVTANGQLVQLEEGTTIHLLDDGDVFVVGRGLKEIKDGATVYSFRNMALEFSLDTVEELEQSDLIEFVSKPQELVAA